MNQISVGTPKGKAQEVAAIALGQGISEASVSQKYVHGPDEEREEVEVLVSAPEGTQFIEAVMSAPFFDPREYDIVSDDVLCIVSKERPERISEPMRMSEVTVLQDLWLQNHVTPAYLARASVSALLLAYGMITGDLTTLIIALLFTPFLAQVLAMAFGLLMRDGRLARQGAMVLALSTVIGVAAGALVAWVTDDPMRFDRFASVQVNFLISLIVALVAGLDTVDIAGRREFIAVAGAAQFAIYPIWFGIALVQGFPDSRTTLWRITTFAVNILTILVVSLLVYVALRFKPHLIERYVRLTRESG